MDESRRNKFYSVYFAFHALITIAIDSAVAIPDKYLFDVQKSLISYHIKQNNDLLLLSRPPWLQGFIWLELVFQLPLFILGCVPVWRDVKSMYPLMIMYGVEASVTTFACLVESLCLDQLSQSAKTNLFFIYLPTCVLPLLIALDYYGRVLKWVPKVKAD